MKKLCMIGFLCVSLWANAQEVPFSDAGSSGVESPASLFTSPLDFPLYLAGNFGELRPNHFHGGLDFKTQGVIGKPVSVIADGYVSRITVSPTGYGNALYVTHPNGYTSVYGHLDRFVSSIARYVEDYQYEHETFAVDLRPDSTLFRFRQRDVIAYSGNTGASGGPHLHLEIRATATDEIVDPMPFFRHHLRDTRPPRALSVMLYASPGEGVINGSGEKQSFTWLKNRSGLNKPVTAWGKIGVGICANDYMDGTANIYGVRLITLTVDGCEVFRSLTDRVAHEENRAINSWTDYEEYRSRRVWYAKSFIEPGNRLRMLRADASRGWVTIDEERDYRFCYRLEDAFGNVSAYRFVVRGTPRQVPSVLEENTRLLRWNEVNVIQKPGMQLTIPRDMLYKDLRVNVEMRADSVAPSFVYQLHDQPVPLHAYCPLKIGLCRRPVADSTKYYVAQKSGDRWSYVGGKYAAGWMTASIRELGTYAIAIDTVAPVVTPVQKASWARSGKIVYRVRDGQTGIASYRGTIDGKFVLFEYSAKDRRLVCRLSRARLQRAKWHELELQVSDRCGNVTVVREKVCSGR